MQVRGQNQQILQVFENYEKSQNGFHSIENESSSFLFDKVFDDQQTNLAVFQGALQPLIPQLLEGYNVSCFAYGMTGSGKTHTMLGADGGQASNQTYDNEMDALKNLGLCNLAIQNLFYQMLLKQDEFTYTLRVSYVELYNEQVRDLLADMKQYNGQMELQDYINQLLEENHLLKEEKYQNDQNFAFNSLKQSTNKITNSIQNLKIVEDPQKGVMVQNLLEVPVAEACDLMDLIKLGNQRRIVANTGANRFSSRSHAILIFNIEGMSKDQTTQTKLIRSKLQIIDLAGSERAASTDNRGQRMVEGALINKSLLALGQCINILSEQCKKAQNSNSAMKRMKSRSPSKGRRHGTQASPNNLTSKSVQKFIPYRDSKLTRLLKDSLGGSTKTVMIACINQLISTYEETMNTIKYASKAKSIQNQKIRNEIIQKEYALEAERELELQRQQFEKQAQLREQQELIQIQNLKDEIEQLRGQSQVQQVGRNYLSPSESIDQIRIPNENNEATPKLTKVQKRKKLKEQKMNNSQVKDDCEVGQLIENFLIPNIVMQYNLRYQLQSHEVVKQMQGQVDYTQEINQLNEEIAQTQQDQEDIQNQIIEMFYQQKQAIQELQDQIQDGQEDVADDDELQNLKYQNNLKAQEICHLEEVINKMSEDLQQKAEVIEEQDGMENVYQAQINKHQTNIQNIENQLSSKNQECIKLQNINQEYELRINDQSEQIIQLQIELAKAQDQISKMGQKQQVKKDQDPKDLYLINQNDKNASTHNTGEAWRQRNLSQQENTNMESSYLNSCLNISEHINRTLDCTTTQEHNDLKPPTAIKSNGQKKKQTKQSRNKDANSTAKNSSKDGSKKQRSLHRYLSGQSKDRNIDTSNHQVNSIPDNTKNMKFIVKRDKVQTPQNVQLSKSNSQINFEKQSINQTLDLRNQKFKRIENQIFQDTDGLMSNNTKQKLDRMKTIQSSQEMNHPVYPKLRQSASNSRFQRNFQPKSTSRLSRSRSRSKSNHTKYQDQHKSLTRCRTNMDVIEPKNALTLMSNKEDQSFTFQSHNNPSFRQGQQKQQQQINHIQSLENFQLPNIMNVSGISMDFDHGDEMAKAEILNYRNQLGEEVDQIGLQKQQKSNPFFNIEENDGSTKRELYHSKSVLTKSGEKTDEIMSPNTKQIAHHSKTNSGALISSYNKQEVSSQKKIDYTQENQRGESKGAAKVKDLVSYAEIRQQSKDRRKQQNAVKNLALNFQNFKNSQNESQQNMKNQMLIVDSIENEILKASRKSNNEGSERQISQRKDSFVEKNQQKIAEINQMQEQIEIRSIERSKERDGMQNMLSMNSTNELRNKFKDGDNKSQKFNIQPRQSSRSSKRSNTQINLSSYNRYDVQQSISPPRRKPNFQVPEYQTEILRNIKNSDKKSQNEQLTERRRFNPKQINQNDSHRSKVSQHSDSSQIFKNFEKTRDEVRQSLERSPMMLSSRQKLQKQSFILQESQGHDQYLIGGTESQNTITTPLKNQTYAFKDQKYIKNHNSSVDFQTSVQNTRIGQYFQMNSNSKSLNTLQTSLIKEKPLKEENTYLDDSVESIEKFRDLQRQISEKYVAKAFKSKSKKRKSQSPSKTPERSHNYAQNLEEFSRNDNMIQTQEKHKLSKYIEHDTDQIRYNHPNTTSNSVFSPEAKAKFHLNLELLNQNDDEIATDSKRVNPLINQQKVIDQQYRRMSSISD